MGPPSFFLVSRVWDERFLKLLGFFFSALSLMRIHISLRSCSSKVWCKASANDVLHLISELQVSLPVDKHVLLMLLSLHFSFGSLSESLDD